MIFVTGNSRSGTTMMGKILGNHPDIFTFRELHFFDEIIRASQFQKKINPGRAAVILALLRSIQRHGFFGPRRYKDYLAPARDEVSDAQVETPAGVYKLFLEMECKLNARSIPCEQTPQNIFYIDQILEAFPNARIIAMIRDPRAILLSQKNKWQFAVRDKFPLHEKVRLRLNYHPITVSNLWNASARQIAKWKTHPRVTIVPYEELIEGSELIICRLCRDLGIDYCSQMLDVPVAGSSNFPDSKERGIRRDRAQVWRSSGLNGTEIKLCQTITADGMNEAGYIPVETYAHPLLELWYYISMPLRLAAALVFNTRRVKNLPQIVRNVR